VFILASCILFLHLNYLKVSAANDLTPQAPKVRSSLRFLGCRASLATTKKKYNFCRQTTADSLQHFL